MIIFRYLLKEVLLMMLAILTVLLIIMLVSQASAYLSRIAAGALSLGYFGYLMLLNIPFLLTFLLPFAFFFALLLAYSRLYAESEMVVLQSSGFSNLRLFGYASVPALLVLIISAYLILDVTPRIIAEKGKILTHSQDNILSTVVPGQFRAFNNGKQILYVGQANHNKDKPSDLFLAQLAEPAKGQKNDNWTVSFIRHAEQHEINGHSYLETNRSYQYRGVPGQADYEVSHYKNYALLLHSGSVSKPYERLDGATTAQLWKNRSQLEDNVELQWRFGLIFQIVILTLLAIPMSKVQPRQGRYAKFLPAIIVYLGYAILLFVGRNLMSRGLINPGIGLWWVQIIMLFGIAIYYMKYYGFARRVRS